MGGRRPQLIGGGIPILYVNAIASQQIKSDKHTRYGPWSGFDALNHCQREVYLTQNSNPTRRYNVEASSSLLHGNIPENNGSLSNSVIMPGIEGRLLKCTDRDLTATSHDILGDGAVATG
jgi:hypothetical protein